MQQHRQSYKNPTNQAAIGLTTVTSPPPQPPVPSSLLSNTNDVIFEAALQAAAMAIHQYASSPSFLLNNSTMTTNNGVDNYLSAQPLVLPPPPPAPHQPKQPSMWPDMTPSSFLTPINSQMSNNNNNTNFSDSGIDLQLIQSEAMTSSIWSSPPQTPLSSSSSSSKSPPRSSVATSHAPLYNFYAASSRKSPHQQQQQMSIQIVVPPSNQSTPRPIRKTVYSGLFSPITSITSSGHFSSSSPASQPFCFLSPTPPNDGHLQRQQLVSSTDGSCGCRVNDDSGGFDTIYGRRKVGEKFNGQQQYSYINEQRRNNNNNNNINNHNRKRGISSNNNSNCRSYRSSLSCSCYDNNAPTAHSGLNDSCSFSGSSSSSSSSSAASIRSRRGHHQNQRNHRQLPIRSKNIDLSKYLADLSLNNSSGSGGVVNNINKLSSSSSLSSSTSTSVPNSKSSNGAAASPNGEMRCAFCENNRESREVYMSHNLKDSLGKIVCPILRNFVCPKCGESGDYAHTDKYCPVTQRRQKENKIRKFFTSNNAATSTSQSTAIAATATPSQLVGGVASSSSSTVMYSRVRSDLE